jgi:ribosomal-protein-alanine N-acetyltransferase
VKPFEIRELRTTDNHALLAFEIDNRQWFEAHIEARAPSFYSLAGVTEHIDSYLSDLASGAWHPFVIEDTTGKIVGRANLKGIDVSGRTAQVGYRIAQRACGQGLATMALRHLITVAHKHWGLTQLEGYAYPENTGSITVLGRCGFLPEAAPSHQSIKDERRFMLSL